jgi:hypothetical protein
MDGTRGALGVWERCPVYAGNFRIASRFQRRIEAARKALRRPSRSPAYKAESSMAYLTRDGLARFRGSSAKKYLEDESALASGERGAAEATFNRARCRLGPGFSAD